MYPHMERLPDVQVVQVQAVDTVIEFQGQKAGTS